KPSARICATRSAAALAEAIFHAQRLCLHRARTPSEPQVPTSDSTSWSTPGITRLARIGIDHAQLNSMRLNVAVHG
ncbi:MAG TPA: hypothetical protein VK621_16580, partial [Bradyrhizobium sp.]|nr:hypothetical protein [Bradyrhizobium sp.]